MLMRLLRVIFYLYIYIYKSICIYYLLILEVNIFWELLTIPFIFC